MNSACAKVLASGQNTCTAQKCRRPEGRFGKVRYLFCMHRARRSKLYIAYSDLFYKSKRVHAAAPPLQSGPAARGFALVLSTGRKPLHPFLQPPSRKARRTNRVRLAFVYANVARFRSVENHRGLHDSVLADTGHGPASRPTLGQDHTPHGPGKGGRR